MAESEWNCWTSVPVSPAIPLDQTEYLAAELNGKIWIVTTKSIFYIKIEEDPPARRLRSNSVEPCLGRTRQIMQVQPSDPALLSQFFQGRSRAAIVACGSKLIVYGGFAHFSVALQHMNSCLVFNTDTNALSLVPCMGASISGQRMFHSMVAVNETVYCIGGTSLDANRVDSGFSMLALDTDTWQWRPVPSLGDVPTPRGLCGATVVGRNIWIFGGADVTGFLNDVYVYETDSHNWSRVLCNGDVPSPRACPSFVAIGNQIWSFGGNAHRGFFNDLHILDIAPGPDQACTWRMLTDKGSPPCARRGQYSFVTNLKGGATPPRLWIWGGLGDRGFYLDSVVLEARA
eukprot:tig00020710_g13380.t1